MSDRPNFRLVERKKVTKEDYNRIKQLYVENEINLKKINKKFNYLGESAFSTIIKQIIKETGYSRAGQCKPEKKNNNLPPRYYSNYHNSYIITKYKNTGNVYYGSYSAEEEAKLIVEELKKVNWDKNELPLIKEQVKEKLSINIYDNEDKIVKECS